MNRTTVKGTSLSTTKYQINQAVSCLDDSEEWISAVSWLVGAIQTATPLPIGVDAEAREIRELAEKMACILEKAEGA